MKSCITTLVSTNHYQYFIPTFVYTCKKYHPDVDIKIFVHGKLDDVLRPYCAGAQIIEDTFTEFTNNTLLNSLRFLLPRHHFREYSYIYFTDIDFVFLKHDKSLFSYMASMMSKMHAVYAGLKGTHARPRIMGSFFMVKYKWFKKTAKYRKAYFLKLKRIQKVPYTYDEYMLYDICRSAGLGVPAKRRCFQNGVKFNREYRNIHLGDFKRRKIYCHSRKMRWYFCAENRKKYLALYQDREFRTALLMARQNNDVKILFARVKAWAKK